MKRIDEIFSQAQKDVSDEEFQKIQRQEWYTFSERVLWDISSSTRSFCSSLEYIPNADGLTNTSAAVVNGNIRPYQLLKVIRGIYDEGGTKTNGRECREHSLQALDNAQRREFAFPPNRTELFADAFTVQRGLDETMTLSFGSVFQHNEIVRINLIHGSPDIPVHWRHTTDIVIPDYMVDCMRYGLLAKGLERLSMQVSNNEYMNRLSRAEQMYSRALQKLKAYLVNLKDENSFPQGQPMVWLPEY